MRLNRSMDQRDLRREDCTKLDFKSVQHDCRLPHPPTSANELEHETEE